MREERSLPLPSPFPTRPMTQRHVLDLTRDLEEVARLSTSPRAIDDLLADALEALGKLVPFDLATIMEKQGERLSVRVARGRLSSPSVLEHELDLDLFPSLREVLVRGRARAFGEDDHASGDGDPFDGVLDLPHGHSCMVVPLSTRSEVLGVMTLDRSECGTYPEGIVALADVFGKALALALKYGRQSERLVRMQAQLAEQNRLLAERISGANDPRAWIESSRSQPMSHVARLAKQVAATSTPVLITGETGTGKEVLARALHAWSDRAERPLVSVNCAALPEGLIESELFGHVRGAFSGATTTRMGRFQAANGGTLFLDEVAEIPPGLQAKLLRVLQEGTLEPVGSDRTVRVDVRLVAATNKDLVKAVAEKTFREDLYYRLAVFPIHVPPLRARREDIAPIAEAFLDSLARRTGRGPWRLTQQTVAELQSREWPGNVRELVNALERATVLNPGKELRLDSAPATQAFPLSEPEAAILTMRDVERAHVERALETTGGRLWGEGGAAALLGVHPSTLLSRMKKLGLGGVRAWRANRLGLPARDG